MKKGQTYYQNIRSGNHTLNVLIFCMTDTLKLWHAGYTGPFCTTFGDNLLTIFVSAF